MTITISKSRIRMILVAMFALAGLGLLAACEDLPAESAPGTKIADSRDNYVPTHDVEGHNYNARVRLADNPSTLIWCTAFPSSPNAKAFTVPIVGKLTSGNKRPYATTQSVAGGGSSGYTYTPEVAGPDGMFGTSGEYRYGFDPAGNYHDYYNLEAYCTNVPNILQKEQTVIVVKNSDPGSDSAAEAALKICREKNPDPTVPCTAATTILGG